MSILEQVLKWLADNFGLTCWYYKRHADVFGYDRYQQPMVVCVRCGRKKR